jgi:glycosyltransferase involved in cell wall biosynthesis
LSYLSVIIITKNEQENIRDCLESVRWADEIVVVDSGSTDDTVQYARAFTKKIFQKEWDGFGETKNFAISKTKGDWVFSIDADERVTPELAVEIRDTLKSQSGSYSGFSMPRKAFFLGRWIRHSGWYPGRVVRLFEKQSGSFTNSKVHESLAVNGRIGTLNADLLHYTDPNLWHYFHKFNRYTTLAAEGLQVQGKSFSFGQLLYKPFWTFFRMYILKLGFLDGIPGFVLSVLSSCYVFTKYAKLWELDRGTVKERYDARRKR